MTVVILRSPCHSFTIRSSHHCVAVQLHCTCSVSPTLMSSCKLLQSARDQLSIRQVSPSSLHTSQKTTEWNSAIRDYRRGVRWWGAALNSVLSAISKKPLPSILFCVRINKWKLCLMALRRSMISPVACYILLSTSCSQGSISSPVSELQ